MNAALRPLRDNVLAQFDVPVGEVDEMLPAIVPVQGEINLHKWPPFRPFGFADEIHAGLVRCAVRLAGIAQDARADDIFPRGGAAAVAGHDVVEVQILAVEDAAAVLAGVLVAFEDVMPGKFDFLLGQAVIHEEEDDARDADAEGDGVDGFIGGRTVGEVAPFVKVEGAERAVGVFHDDLRVALKEES